MHRRLLDILRCPHCGAPLELVDADATAPEGEIDEGLLRCRAEHPFAVTRGIPRLLPGAATDRRTSENFSHEWEHHELADKTWGMELADRVRWFFVEPLGLSPEELRGKRLLDAGCGNGSQSVAYTALGLEVVAVDLSSGLERGHAFRSHHAGADPERVDFVQADLQRPPFEPASFDIIHSAGVLHHTPNTERTFRGLCPMLRPGGTFYVWVYKREPVVTPVVDAIRKVTTRLPANVFAVVARLLAPLFQVFVRTVSALGIRAYEPMQRREAALALMDIFGAPYAHAHTYDEVREWFVSEGFDEVRSCNDDRRGFGVVGRLGGGRRASGQQLLANAKE
jgi:SAM-dependent methyltransferase